MAVYIILWFLLLFLAGSSKTVQKPLLYGSVLLLSLLAGFRSLDTGTDTLTYRDIFEWTQLGSAAYVEPGWRILNYTVGAAGGDYHFFLWLSSFLMLFITARVIVKDSPNPMLSMFIYFSMYIYLNSFNLMRQALAMSFLLLAYSHLYRNRTKLFFLDILLATLIHFFSIVAVSVFWLRKIRLSPSRIVWLCLLSLTAGLFLINDNILSLILGKYAVYLSMEGFGYRDDTTGAIMLTLILNLLLLFIVRTLPTDLRENLWFKIYFWSIIINNGSLRLVLGSRVLLLFSIAQVIFFVLYCYKNRITQPRLAGTIVISYLAVLFYKMLLNNAGEVVPYRLASF